MSFLELSCPDPKEMKAQNKLELKVAVIYPFPSTPYFSGPEKDSTKEDKRKLLVPLPLSEDESLWHAGHFCRACLRGSTQAGMLNVMLPFKYSEGEG